MKLFKLITVLCAICSLFLMTMPGSVFAAETQKVITVASDATWPPMEMIDGIKTL